VIHSVRESVVRLRDWLLELPRLHKRMILVGFDLAMLGATLALIIRLRTAGVADTTVNGALLLTLAPILTVGTFAWFGLYRLVTRYIGHRGNTRIAGGVALATLVWALIVFMSGQQGVPRSSVVLYALAGTAVIIASRHLAAWVLKSAGIVLAPLAAESEMKRVLIYGAGATGVRLLEAVRRVADREAVGFVDSSSTLWGQYVGGLKVYPPTKLASLIERRGIDEVLLALPDGQRGERRAILERLRGHPVTVKLLPALEDIASGRVSVSDLKSIDVDDLLGRDPVPPHGDLLGRNIKGKSILVTGAGGSVGSELVRQILRQGPERLVLLDQSELALYTIEMQVKDMIALAASGVGHPHVVAVLGSVTDATLVSETLRRHEIETVFHAAAYKHVPLVEANRVIGIENNTFGTKVLADCAVACGVERVVLISTDKAVRPTNVMGASKRLAEMVLQARAADPECRTVFTMVRFGNVLDSSGSVVGLFRRQIRAGGPVTVTHPDVVRYFMSIPEAAALVIQAGAMATGGDVFVLEMGEPVKIHDLAQLMIRLTGLEVRSDERPDGDIAIVYTGLRPGEKLYEELLIGANTQGTEHPRIMRSDEPFLSQDDLDLELGQLRKAMAGRDFAAIETILLRTVEGFRPDDVSANSVNGAGLPFETVDGGQAPTGQAQHDQPALDQPLARQVRMLH
jgi:FlaA1/EpsC-like NDP-sugar epimerase